MKLLLKKIVLFLLVPVIVTVSLFIYFGAPPPKLSTSVSFDAKMHFMKKNYSNTPVDILAFGSSICLNNSYSTSIIKESKNNRFLNISSWGQNMKENYNLLKIFAKIHKPTTVLLVSNYIDFADKNKQIKYDLLDEYVSNTKPTIYYYLQDLKIKYLLWNAIRLHFYKKVDNRFGYLKYDKHGSVRIPLKKPAVSDAIWEGHKLKKGYFSNVTQYLYLDSISKYCLSHQIKLFYILSPFREGYYSRLGNQELALLNNLTGKLRSILSKNNAYFVNTLNIVWPDSLFLDYSHFNKLGAKKFTEHFLKEMKKEQLLRKVYKTEIEGVIDTAKIVMRKTG